MIPAEIEPRTIDLPPTSDYPVVVATGPALRHRRFALRMQQEFDVVGWLEIKPPSKRTLKRDWKQAPQLAARLFRRLRKSRGEQAMLEKEVEVLSRDAKVQPRKVATPNSQEVIDWLAERQPYFIVTLGGAVYGKKFIESARGIALNQHDGWCPTYKGSGTVDWALYFRDITHIGNTVHVLTTGLDSGPMLRRSTACLVPGDNRNTCFVRSVVLGTELMIESMHELIATHKAVVFDQPDGVGATYLGRELQDYMTSAIQRDFRAGWFKQELARWRQF